MTSNQIVSSMMSWLRVMLGYSLFCFTPFAIWNIAQFVEKAGQEPSAVFGIGFIVGMISLSVLIIAIRLVIPVDVGSFRYKWYGSSGRNGK